MPSVPPPLPALTLGWKQAEAAEISRPCQTVVHSLGCTRSGVKGQLCWCTLVLLPASFL